MHQTVFGAAVLRHLPVAEYNDFFAQEPDCFYRVLLVKNELLFVILASFASLHSIKKSLN